MSRPFEPETEGEPQEAREPGLHPLMTDTAYGARPGTAAPGEPGPGGMLPARPMPYRIEG